MLFQGEIEEFRQAEDGFRLVVEALLADGAEWILHDDGLFEGDEIDPAALEDMLEDFIDPETDSLELSVTFAQSRSDGEAEAPDMAATKRVVEQFGGVYLHLNEGEWRPAGGDRVVPPFAEYFSQDSGAIRTTVSVTPSGNWRAVVSPDASDDERFVAQEIDAVLRREGHLFPTGGKPAPGR